MPPIIDPGRAETAGTYSGVMTLPQSYWLRSARGFSGMRRELR
jgi:hypothetical protein